MNQLQAKLLQFSETTNAICEIVLNTALRKVIRTQFHSSFNRKSRSSKPVEIPPTPQEDSVDTPQNHLSALFRYIHDKRVQRRKAPLPRSRLAQNISLLPQVNQQKLAGHLHLALDKPSPEVSEQSLHARQYSEGLRYRSMKRALKLKQRLLDDKFNRDFYMRNVQAISRRPSVSHILRKDSHEKLRAPLLSKFYYQLAFPARSRSRSLLNVL